MGEWVAIVNRRIIAFGPDFGRVLDTARAKGSEPLMMHVPEEGVLIL